MNLSLRALRALTWVRDIEHTSPKPEEGILEAESPLRSVRQ